MAILDYFQSFLKSDNIFLNKNFLQSNYTPETLPHRDEQIKQLAGILAPILKLNKPSNIFVYGKTGTGKTLSVRYTTNKILEIAYSKNIPITVLYLNCKMKKIADTEYRLIAQLARDMGKTVPPTGLPTDEVYKIFFSVIDQKEQQIILILDEIDQLIKKAGDEILYNLTRINTELKKAQITLVGISNDLLFTDNIDPRVKSSLSEEEITFPPYNALQIQDILQDRAKVAFRSGVLAPGVIGKCAAYAAREHGDARRALELLRIAGELAERNSDPCVEISHLDNAEEKIERDKVYDIVISQPKQFQTTLYAIIILHLKNPMSIETGELYEIYKQLSLKIGMRPLTQRRISDIISELDMLGIINAKVTSKGRYGRTRAITLAVPPGVDKKLQAILQKELGLS